MSTYWWDNVGPNGLPRFYMFSTPTKRKDYRRIVIVELKLDAVDLPKRWPDSKTISVLLLRTEPLYWGKDYWKAYPGSLQQAPWIKRTNLLWERGERVITKLASMPLSIMAVQRETGPGVNKLFDKLWLEDVEQYDEIYPRRSLRRA